MLLRYSSTIVLISVTITFEFNIIVTPKTTYSYLQFSPSSCSKRFLISLSILSLIAIISFFFGLKSFLVSLIEV